MREADFAVVGAGIAGAAIAYHLSEGARVVILEQETHPGYHTTSRSAAVFLPSYGNLAIRALTAASQNFLEAPVAGFADHPLLTERGCLTIARADQLELLRARRQETSASAVWLDGSEACSHIPALRKDYVAAALLEYEAKDIDVHALHHGFLRSAKARGATLITSATVQTLRRTSGVWQVRYSGGICTAPVLVNAAGPWARAVAALADAAPLEVRPLKRTALIIDPPPGFSVARWPAVLDVAEEFYFKPETGRLLLSPADESPCVASDVQADEFDVAVAVDRVQRAADIPVKRILRAWAGLRCFVADRTPVIGFDRRAEGFFWLAALGGYGIQTSPAIGRLAAALALGISVPADLTDFGINPDSFAPSRPALCVPGTK